MILIAHRGNIDGKKYEMNKIVHSTEQGICWYIK